MSYVPQRMMHHLHIARLCWHNATPTLPSQILNRRGLAFARASLRSHPPRHTRVLFESTITLCILRGLEGEDSAGSGDRKRRSRLDEEGQKRLSRKWMDGRIGKWGDLKMSASMFASICSVLFFFFFFFLCVLLPTCEFHAGTYVRTSSCAAAGSPGGMSNTKDISILPANDLRKELHVSSLSSISHRVPDLQCPNHGSLPSTPRLPAKYVRSVHAHVALPRLLSLVDLRRPQAAQAESIAPA